jgi:hypothetical protein
MTIEFNKVTWYSKLLAVIVFLCVFAVAFYLGKGFGELERQTVPLEEKLAGIEGKPSLDEIIQKIDQCLPLSDMESRETCQRLMADAWPFVAEAINNCEVKRVSQAHSLMVSADLEDGRRIIALEPGIDDIWELAEAAESRCGHIPVATE